MEMLCLDTKQLNYSGFPQRRKFNKSLCFCHWGKRWQPRPTSLRGGLSSETESLSYFTAEDCIHTGELIWNKYRRTAIPEYLLNFPSGKKELKDRPAISLSPFFLYIFDSVPRYRYLHHGPYGQPADQLQSQFKFHHFGLYLAVQRQTFVPFKPTVWVHFFHYPYTRSFPRYKHTVTWDFTIQHFKIY